ncbi:ATP-binding protein [Dactylosporangium roseum]|uniref:ATP-binding protein n=1 Tax=Dactylosporangium roseum TaxID=47989 RepID=A0ABY5Z6A5_9ACTN|nr:ATP-binding protein [Dactylosporangium roseum]UWZ37189.1 ATP-binding protein [Dactylosporangium roseum]
MTDPNQDAKFTRFAALNNVFTPGTPVLRRDRFHGRVDQIFEIINSVAQPGTHVVLYGERGVGKTSLANVLSDFLAPIWGSRRPTVRVNCTTDDKFKTIWTRVLQEMALDVPEEWALGKAGPDSVRRILQEASPPRLVILDEFDRVEDDESLSLMADTVKALSDHAVDTRLIIVGMADSIDALIGEHESIQRAIAEVQLGRMEPAELGGIIDDGLAQVSMTITPTARHRIGRLAEGLPQYVHMLTLYAAQRAVIDDRGQVDVDDVRDAIDKVAKKHSLLREYQTAVQSPRRDNLFAQVLAACALAEKNRLGYFTPGAVKEPMSRLMGKPYDIANFATHLSAFTGSERGFVLQRSGVERKYVYRFKNPLLQPFALLAALSEGIISKELVDEILGESPNT